MQIFKMRPLWSRSIIRDVLHTRTYSSRPVLRSCSFAYPPSMNILRSAFSTTMSKQQEPITAYHVRAVIV